MEVLGFPTHWLWHTNIPRQPLSYTIVPISEWNSFTPAAISTSSLVHIQAASLYHHALGYMIGALSNQANECALIAVLPKVKYPNIPLFAENEHDSNPPLKKQSKIESPSHHPQLFNPTYLHICKPWCALHQSSNLYTTIFKNGFQCFFKNKFPDIQSNGEIHVFDLDGFTWLVHQRESDTVVTEQSSSKLQATTKDPPVYHYWGHFYYLGM